MGFTAIVMDKFECLSVDGLSVEKNLAAAVEQIWKKFPGASLFEEPTFFKRNGIDMLRLQFLTKMEFEDEVLPSMADLQVTVRMCGLFNNPKVVGSVLPPSECNKAA